MAIGGTSLLEKPGNNMRRVKMSRVDAYPTSLLDNVYNILIDFWGREEDNGLAGPQLSQSYSRWTCLNTISFKRGMAAYLALCGPLFGRAPVLAP